jgi:hypothetical protein
VAAPTHSARLSIFNSLSQDFPSERIDATAGTICGVVALVDLAPLLLDLPSPRLSSSRAA